MKLRPCWLLALLVVFLVLSRVFFWTSHPPDFDFANFALGVERFAPADHQPHPPGYPYVILVAKMFAALGMPVLRALQLTALAGSIAAILGAYWLGKRLAGERGGLLASFLLAIEPAFWRSGVNSPTRVYLAAGALWLLYSLLKVSVERPASLWLAAGLVALFAGFRPELLVFFAVPFVAAARLAGFSLRRIACTAAVSLAACLPWIIWITHSFGSPFRLVYTYYHYFLHHMKTTSALLGAPAEAWQTMLLSSLVWNGISGAVAIVAVLASRRWTELDRRFLALAGAYFLPAIFVQLLLHEGNDSPGHSLGTIAILLVIAGALLGAARLRWVAAVAAAAMLSISFSTPGIFRPALDVLSLRSFASAQSWQARLIAGLRTSLRPSDAIVVLNDSPVSWRILEYEFPENHILSLDSTIQPSDTARAGGYEFFQRRGKPLEGKRIFLPAVKRLHILSHPTSAQRKLIQERLCGEPACDVDDARVAVKLAGRKEPVSLPPYWLHTE